VTITDRMAAWRRERRVLQRVSRAAWRLEQAERERARALAPARAEGVSIRTLARDPTPGRTGQDLVPGVLTVSRRAQALCRRPGLTEVARDGERGTKVTMRAARHRRQQLARSPRRCEICLCAIAGRLASSAVKAEEPGLPRHDRCSLQPARSPLPEIACPTLKRLRAWLVSGRGSPAATVGGRPGTDAGLSGCRTRRRYSR